MTGHYILADATSHKRGFGVRSIIDAVTRRAINTGDPSDGVLWIKPNYLTQFPLSTNALISDDPGTTWELLTKQIAQIKATSPSREIVIVTWDHLIYDRAKNFGPGVTGVKWFDWLEEDRGQRVADRQPAPALVTTAVLKPSSALPSVEHLTDLVAQYLISVHANSQGTSIYRSQLRPALIKAFPELNVASSSPFFAQSLKAALDVAIDTGRFAESRLSPGRERLWLVESRIVEQPPQAEAAETTKEEPEVKTNPVFSRSAEFRKRLTEQGIFCEKRERDILVEALPLTLKDGPSTISRLRRELPKTAITLAAERGICADVDFSRVTNFFLKLCLVAGLLKNADGNVIVRSAGAEATKVVALVDEPLEIAETYLLEQVIKKSDVQDREHWQLAHALFREFNQSEPLDDKLDRIAELIARLGPLVVLTDDGTYEYTQNLPVTSNIHAIRA